MKALEGEQAKKIQEIGELQERLVRDAEKEEENKREIQSLKQKVRGDSRIDGGL